MMASLTVRVYQCGLRLINLISFQIWKCPVLLACSEAAEVRDTRKLYVSVVFFYPFMHRSPFFPDIHFAAFTRTLISERIKNTTETYGLPVPKPPTVSEHANKTGHFPIWNEVKSDPPLEFTILLHTCWNGEKNKASHTTSNQTNAVSVTTAKSEGGDKLERLCCFQSQGAKNKVLNLIL